MIKFLIFGLCLSFTLVFAQVKTTTTNTTEKVFQSNLDYNDEALYASSIAHQYFIDHKNQKEISVCNVIDYVGTLSREQQEQFLQAMEEKILTPINRDLILEYLPTKEKVTFKTGIVSKLPNFIRLQLLATKENKNVYEMKKNIAKYFGEENQTLISFSECQGVIKAQYYIDILGGEYIPREELEGQTVKQEIINGIGSTLNYDCNGSIKNFGIRGIVQVKNLENILLNATQNFNLVEVNMEITPSNTLSSNALVYITLPHKNNGKEQLIPSDQSTNLVLYRGKRSGLERQSLNELFLRFTGTSNDKKGNAYPQFQIRLTVSEQSSATAEKTAIVKNHLVLEQNNKFVSQREDGKEIVLESIYNPSVLENSTAINTTGELCDSSSFAQKVISQTRICLWSHLGERYNMPHGFASLRANFQKIGYQVKYEISDTLPFDLSECDQLWVALYASQRRLYEEDISKIVQFHNEKNGVFIWADDQGKDELLPANDLLRGISGIDNFTQDYRYLGTGIINNLQIRNSSGQLLNPILYGLDKVYEGHSISAINKSILSGLPSNYTPIIRADLDQGQVISMAHEDRCNTRWFFDGAWTRAHQLNESTKEYEGTLKYLRNVACWLINFEAKRKSFL